MPLPLLGAVIRVIIGVFELVIISLVMQVGLALPMAYYFHRATVVALPANMVVVPLTQVLMPSAVLALALGYISLLLAKIPALIAGAALEGIAGTVHRLGGLQIADARVPTPGIVVVIMASACLALAMILIRRRTMLAVLGLAALALSAFWICAGPARPEVQAGALEVTTIDVGQGDSILLVSPQGQTLLVDAGGCRAGRIQNWILAKMWFRHIYGREDFGSSMQWQSPTHIRITWVGWRRWWRTFVRGNSG